MNRRALYAALVLSLGATAWLALEPEDTSTALVVQQLQVRSAPMVAGVGSTRVPRAATTWPDPPRPHDGGDPWLIGSDALAGWAPPPMPATPPTPPARPLPAVSRVVEAAPPVPTAPAFPYQLIGRLEGDGLPTALLNGPLRTLSVKAQDTIDGQWRVEAVLPTGVSVLWLPGGQKQTVSFRPS